MTLFVAGEGGKRHCIPERQVEVKRCIASRRRVLVSARFGGRIGAREQVFVAGDLRFIVFVFVSFFPASRSLLFPKDQ